MWQYEKNNTHLTLNKDLVFDKKKIREKASGNERTEKQNKRCLVSKKVYSYHVGSQDFKRTITMFLQVPEKFKDLQNKAYYEYSGVFPGQKPFGGKKKKVM